MDYKIILIILAVVVGLYLKFKSVLFGVKDDIMVKEDQALKVKQDNIKTEIFELKAELSEKPEQLDLVKIEEFWNGKK